MKPSPDPRQRRRLHPLPKGLVELYGLIAVLVVLIPEWIADGTLALNERPSRSAMPMTSRAWRTLPELQLASMTLCELRLLARDLHLWGYSSDHRDKLTNRLLKRSTRLNKARNAL